MNPIFGKKAVMQKIEMTIDGMMCGMCEAHIKDAIRKKIPEAKKLTADHTTREASFLLDEPMPLGMVKHDLNSAFKDIGYKLLDVSESEVQKKKGLFGFHR
ncbi:MAG: heavy-metal-associated domain-containing protein [Lachnospiraceae bacterium]|nr:MAG: heavy-metal-associated domain-containing protein [Lachnospiraceae bacterium]